MTPLLQKCNLKNPFSPGMLEIINYITFYIAKGSINWLTFMLHITDFQFLCSDCHCLMNIFVVWKYLLLSCLLAHLQCGNTWDFSLMRPFLVSNRNQVTAAVHMSDEVSSFPWRLWVDIRACFPLPTDVTSVVSSVIKHLASVRWYVFLNHRITPGWT